MGVIGAIIGDIAGSKYEFSKKHPQYIPNQPLTLDESFNYSEYCCSRGFKYRW